MQADIEFLSDGPFEAEATLRALPGLRTMACVTSLQRMHRTRALVADGDDDLALLINGGGALAPSQLGREASLGAGDAVLTLNAEPSAMIYSDCPWRCSFRAPRWRRWWPTRGRGHALIPHDNDALRLLTAISRSCTTTSRSRRPSCAIWSRPMCTIWWRWRSAPPATAPRLRRSAGVRAARLAAVKADVIAHVATAA